jgi:tetrahydromethanopterin S-methyltransferase subunit G
LLPQPSRYNEIQPWTGSPFFTVALPIVITLIVSIVVQNKRMEELSKRIDDLRTDMNRQFDAVNHRLDRIESKLETHSERIAKLEGPSLVRSS